MSNTLRLKEFKGTCIQIPQGKVAKNRDELIVLVGHRAQPIQEELIVLIESKFHPFLNSYKMKNRQ